MTRKAATELHTPYPAALDDIPGWMALVHKVKEAFPGLDEADFEKRLAEYIQRNEAWVIRYNGEIAASLLFSKERQELDFLAVAPEYRRRGLAEKLVETAVAQFPAGTQLIVTTYRQGDAKGKAARAFYEALGFIPGQEVTVFDYPCQILGFTVPDGTPVSKM
jgi:ribosomal protein S18 acetylase RimI-like enzyme